MKTEQICENISTYIRTHRKIQKMKKAMLKYSKDTENTEKFLLILVLIKIVPKQLPV